jgi:hypothetical protein
MPTFADGGRNTGPYIFLLGRVFGSDNIANSVRVMKAAANYDHKPWLHWGKWGAEALDEWFEEASTLNANTPVQAPQYLVVQWNAITYLPWIQHYGSWDFETQSGAPRDSFYRLQPLELDLQNGVFVERGGQTFQLSSADILNGTGSRHYEFSGQEDGLHLLLNSSAADVYLMGDLAYQSTLVQLLIQPVEPDTGSIDGCILLVDALPDVRIFRIE